MKFSLFLSHLLRYINRMHIFIAFIIRVSFLEFIMVNHLYFYSLYFVKNMLYYSIDMMLYYIMLCYYMLYVMIMI